MILTDQQRRAAQLLGQGRGRNVTASEIGVDRSTVSRWKSNPDFEEAVERARLGVVADNPGIRAMLTSALGAVTSDGSPDWKTRLSAAKELRAWLGIPDAPPEPDDRIEWGGDDAG